MYVLCQMVHISADTSNTIVSEISAILSDMQTFSGLTLVYFSSGHFVQTLIKGMQQARWITQQLCQCYVHLFEGRLHVHISHWSYQGGYIDNLLGHIVFGHQMRHAAFGSALCV